MGVHLYLQVLNDVIFERVTTLFGSLFEMIGSPLSQGDWVQPYDENDIGRGFFALCWAVYQGERVNAFNVTYTICF